ncbi:helix-turn-helix domain-containing protein [Halomicrobium sp. LC1Hm]|uniref:helix-turn-helix domain-containing protein n=1 Tax=Halomicrobium sp. LC1Hm TaxID=2610902 RepID=UPI00129847E0|nr:helix-turn-helix domain-containing protein [Halomicrobium sp. LC1Hm]QGA82130.1 Transcriptional regulator, contains HTH domain [Halomicrobium sp. LC1Hm]
MREFEFTVQYESGADDLMDLFVETPSLYARSQACFANADAMWRIDRIVGPSDVLDRLDDLYLDESICNECLDMEQCSSTREYQLLDAGPEHRLVYTRRQEIDRCHSIPYLAVDYVGDGVLFDAERSGDEYVWRVLMPEATPVGELYDAIERNLRDGLTLELGHVAGIDGWRGDDAFDADLTVEERRTLQAAVDAGYYRTPRETTVGELGERLDVPRSTVQYRLQRAEGKAVEQFADGSL